MNKMVNKRLYSSSSLEKALALLDLFQPKDAELRLTEIAGRLNVNPGSLYPALKTLERYGYLKRDPHSKRYSLGVKFLERAHLVLQQLNLQERAKSHLKQLAYKCQANAHLAVLYQNKVMYLSRVEAAPCVVLEAILGRCVPVYCTALGKVFLAALATVELANYFAHETFEPLTSFTITNAAALKEELKQVSQDGYAHDREEFQEGTTCIAAPVWDYRGGVIAAISISFPAGKTFDERETQFITAVKDTAARISMELGYIENNKGGEIQRHELCQT